MTEVTVERFVNDYMANVYKDYEGLVEINSTSEVKMNKTGNPLYKRVTKETTQLWNVTNDTYKEKLLSAGASSDYKVESDGKITVVPNKVKFKDDPNGVNKYIDNDGNVHFGKYYLVTYSSDTVPDSDFYVDGRPATDEDMEIIAEFGGIRPAYQPVQKQIDAGVDEHESVQYRTLIIDKFNWLKIDGEKFVFIKD